MMCCADRGKIFMRLLVLPSTCLVSVSEAASEVIFHTENATLIGDNRAAGGALSLALLPGPASEEHPREDYLCEVRRTVRLRVLSLLKAHEFKLDNGSGFRVFADMSAATAHRRREFVGLIDNFKKSGAPPGIVQLANLKVLYKAQAKIFLSEEFFTAH
ncbi:hypothetical protein NDU88_005046 [Pleurodeles waltl]|uniref:Uncharacterized protein n=1 Tax=Pleurodeles waltl TaxID=8319 RepID=A0AAV7QK26_PLEWA|nr:hypothetical protein NDU88_005046 [Pleurodeles waltl]